MGSCARGSIHATRRGDAGGEGDDGTHHITRLTLPGLQALALLTRILPVVHSSRPHPFSFPGRVPGLYNAIIARARDQVEAAAA